jgi:hypothetical protein
MISVPTTGFPKILDLTCTSHIFNSIHEHMTPKRSDNLCNFYILPLLGINKSSFGGSGNFVNSYLSNDLTHIIVELFQPLGNFEGHPEYRVDYYQNGVLTVVFYLPERFRRTATMFKEGKYSQFSSEAKQLIKSKSGLNYRVPRADGKLNSSKILLALDKDPSLKADWENTLGVRLHKDAELMDIPSDDEFKEFEIERVQQGNIH